MMKVTFKSEGLDGLADKIERAAARGRLAVAAVDAVNTVTKRAEKSLIEGELADINLSPAYVKSKTDMTLAAVGGKSARAEIVTRGDLTILGNFKPVSRIVAPGAKRRAGPIKGFRSAGVGINIRKSLRIMEPQWFLMRLKAGNVAGDKYGVFMKDDSIAPKNDRGKGLGDAGRRRDGKAGKRHIYGPSPYALFRAQIAQQFDAIQDDLSRTALSLMGDEFEETLK